MNNTPRAVEPACPNCGGKDFQYVIHALVGMPARKFAINSDGELTATVNKSAARAFFDNVDEVEFPWHCEHCNAEFTGEDLIEGQAPLPIST